MHCVYIVSSHVYLNILKSQVSFNIFIGVFLNWRGLILFWGVLVKLGDDERRFKNDSPVSINESLWLVIRVVDFNRVEVATQ